MSFTLTYNKVSYNRHLHLTFLCIRFNSLVDPGGSCLTERGTP
jgi:hypothetical protein